MKLLYYPYPLPVMRADYKKKALDGVKRLEGLTKKVRQMIETDEYCPHILVNLLAMKGHMKHIQGNVLESHLHTCLPARIEKKKDYDTFMKEIIQTIGLTGR